MFLVLSFLMEKMLSTFWIYMINSVQITAFENLKKFIDSLGIIDILLENTLKL